MVEREYKLSTANKVIVTERFGNQDLYASALPTADSESIRAYLHRRFR